MAYVSLNDIVIQDQYATKQGVEFAPVIEEVESPHMEEVANKAIYELRNTVRGKDKMDILKYCINEIVTKLQNDPPFQLFLNFMPDNQMSMSDYIAKAQQVTQQIDDIMQKQLANIAPTKTQSDMEMFTKHFLKYTHDKVWIDQYFNMFTQLPDPTLQQTIDILQKAQKINEINLLNIETFKNNVQKFDKVPTDVPVFRIQSKDDVLRHKAKIMASQTQIVSALDNTDQIKSKWMSEARATRLLNMADDINASLHIYAPLYTLMLQPSASAQSEARYDSFVFQFVDDDGNNSGNKIKVRSFVKNQFKGTPVTYDFTGAIKGADESLTDKDVFLFTTDPKGWTQTNGKIKKTIILDQTPIKIGSTYIPIKYWMDESGAINTVLNISEPRTFFIKQVNNQFLLTLQEINNPFLNI